MKKVFSILILSLCFLFSACDINEEHKHEYVDGVCSCGDTLEKTFNVVFRDINGNIIKEEMVNENDSATAPNPPVVDGYIFVSWNIDFSNVTSDLEVIAVYREASVETYTVTFIDFYGNIIKEENYEANSVINYPNPPEVPFHTFASWSKDITKVTENVSINALYEAKNEEYEMENVNYWLQILSKKNDIKKEILNSDEIIKYNESVISDYSKTKVVDVTKGDANVTKTYVSSLINNYSNINKYTVYNNANNSAINSTVKNEILSNRNLNDLNDNIEVKYGLVVDFAWLRTYPTNFYSNNYSMDRFQETSLNVGEGLRIYHESLDGKWYFVQAENYNGWIEKKYVALTTYDSMKNFLKCENKLTVISDYVLIEEAYVRMGQTFPLKEVRESAYVIDFPIRNSDGNLELKEVVLNKSNDFYEGYLEYTYENIFIQAFKLLGIDYSWGDKSRLGRDCSSTMNAVYKCFGFMMPRNTSNQKAIPGYGINVSGVTQSSMKSYQAGTLIFTSSHVMMYIGENEDGVAYLLHNTNAGNGGCILQSLDSYGGSKMIGILKLY